jgi:hypothetical protein
MTDDLLAFRAKTFFQVLRDHSQDKEDPISEWEFAEVVDGDGHMTCICTTPIRYLYKIRNRVTHDTLIVGSECIKRWMGGLLRCQRCDCRLGNIRARLRKKQFHCRICRQILQREESQRKNSKLSTLRLFWFGPYYKKQFREVIDDVPYVEKLLNVTNKTKTLELFEEYVHEVYDVITASQGEALPSQGQADFVGV